MKAKNVATVTKHHRRIAALSFHRRRRASRELARAEKEVGKRITTRLERHDPMLARREILVNHMQPYVEKYGAHTVTTWIRTALPPYFAIRRKSVRLGDNFDGWVITRIG